jgi:hypothetical protein
MLVAATCYLRAVFLKKPPLDYSKASTDIKGNAESFLASFITLSLSALYRTIYFLTIATALWKKRYLVTLPALLAPTRVTFLTVAPVFRAAGLVGPSLEGLAATRGFRGRLCRKIVFCCCHECDS